MARLRMTDWRVAYQSPGLQSNPARRARWATTVDFADTAAALSQLDLVIAVDTAVAHLAGALGVPVWILIAHEPEWR